MQLHILIVCMMDDVILDVLLMCMPQAAVTLARVLNVKACGHSSVCASSNVRVWCCPVAV